MTTDDEFLESFLEDYYAECDEHLLSIRKALLSIEESLGSGDLDKEILERLLRNFHTIKGLSAMVGISQAEELSHNMEDILKGLKRGELSINKEILEILNRGIKELENIIVAKREGNPLPDIANISRRLKEIVLTGKREKVQEGKSDDAIDKKVEEGFDIWIVRFTPSQDLIEKGINVELVRSKLEEIGEIIRVEPKIGLDKKISFEFFLATRRKDESKISLLKDYGIEYQLYRAGADLSKAEQVEGRKSFFISPSNFVRVDILKLENLMQILGELVVTKSRLENNLKGIEGVIPPQSQRELEETNHLLERYLRELRESLVNMRLVPMREVFDRMRFVINDLIRESNKRINLEITGEETEVDKFIVERLIDPILHLVRNAVSHGIEPEEERIKKGKPPAGKLSLRAYTVGETIGIEVEDDGRGINPSIIAKKALELGIIKEESEVNGTDKIIDIICSPDFSTREETDRASGRGVGMAIVKSTITELGGSLSLKTEIDRGTCFTIQLPITLTIIEAIIVKVGEQRYAVPLSSVKEIVEIYQDQIIEFGNERFVPYRDKTLPVLYLSEIFNMKGDNNRRKRYALVTGEGEKVIGIVVDRVLAIKETVVRPIVDPLVRNPVISGATDLGDGRLILILNLERIRRGGEKLNAG